MMNEEAAGNSPADEGAEFMKATAFEDKKNLFWMGGMMECFSGVMNIFGRREFNINGELYFMKVIKYFKDSVPGQG